MAFEAWVNELRFIADHDFKKPPHIYADNNIWHPLYEHGFTPTAAILYDLGFITGSL